LTAFVAWVSSGNSAVFGAIKDPNNNVAIGKEAAIQYARILVLILRTEMHQYLDSDGSGTSATCVSSTIGAERLAAATAWLKANNLKGFLGEIGAGNNAACISQCSAESTRKYMLTSY
jgi:endoglucanase